MNLSPDQWDTLLGIPSSIQTTAPVAAQAQQDYSQALATAFDWTPTYNYAPPEQSYQGLATGQQTYTPPADPFEQFLPPESLLPYQYGQAQNAANAQVDPSFNWAPAPDLQQLSSDWGEQAYLTDEWRKLQEIIPQGGIGQPIGAKGRDLAGKALSADIPVVSPFLRDVVEPAVAWAAANDPGPGAFFGRQAYNLLPGGDMSRQQYGEAAANLVVPNTALDVALTAAPFAGKFMKALPKGGFGAGIQGTPDDILGKVFAKGAGEEATLDDLLQQSVDALKANPKAKLTPQVPATGTGPRVDQAFGDDLMRAVDLERQAAWRAAGGDVDRAAAEHLDELSRASRQGGAPIPQVPPTPAPPVRTPIWQNADEIARAADTPVQSGGAAPPPPPPPPRNGVPDFDPEKWRENLGRYKAENDPFTDIQPKSLPKKIADNLLAIPSAWKSTQASGDILGGSIRQNLPTWFAETRSAAKGMKKGWQAYFTDPDTFDIMQAMDDIPLFKGGQVTGKSGKLIDIAPMSDVMKLNSWQTPGFELLNDSAVARWSRNYPLLRRGDQGLRANMVAAASDARARWVKQAVAAGIEDPAWYKHYDDIARVMVGAGDVPGWAKGLSSSFYSLQNLAARVQMFTKPITNPGPVLRSPARMVADKSIFSASPRGVASRNLTRFMGGELANLRALSAAGEMSGLFSVGWDPLGTGFGRLEFDDENGNTYSTDLLGGYGSMIKATARISDGLGNPDSKYDPAGEALSFFRNKTAPFTSLLVDTALANLPGTRDNPAYDSPWAVNLFDPKTWTTAEGVAGAIEKTLPFWAGEAVSSLVRGTLDISNPTDLMRSAGLMLTQVAGGPTSLFQATPGESLEAEANKLNPPIPWAEMGNAERAEWIAANPSLKPLYDKQQAAREGRSAEITDWKYDALSEISNLAQSDPKEYRRIAGDVVREAAIRYDEASVNGEIRDYEVTSEIGKAVDGYYKALEPARTGPAPDYNLQEKLGAEYLATLSPELQERVLRELAFSKDETYAQLLRDRMALAEYFNMRDKEWQATAAKNPRFAGTSSSDEWVQKEVERLTASGQAPATAKIIAEAVVSAYTAQSSIGSKIYLVKNRDKIALLNRWGYEIADSIAALDPEFLKQYQGAR